MALPWTASSLLTCDLHDDDGERPYVPNPRSVRWVQRPNNQRSNMDMLYKCPDPAGAQLEGMPCSDLFAESGVSHMSAAPRSRHPGGVNVAFADGRVNFLPDDVDEYAFAYLVGGNDGHVVEPMEHVR